MFQTGTSTSVTDLVQKLATFLASAGWTINKNQLEGSNWFVNAQKGSDLYLNFLANVAAGTSTDPGPAIELYGATSYSAGATSSTQPGTSLKCRTNKMPGPFTGYWFFEGDDYIHIVVEVSAGVFRHIHGGILNKVCTFTGGQYVVGTHLYYSSTNPSNPTYSNNQYPWESKSGVSISAYNYLRADAGEGAQWYTNYESATVGTRQLAGVRNPAGLNYLYAYGLEMYLFNYTPNAANGITPLIPINAGVELSSGLFSLLGQPKDLRRVSMANYNPGDIMTIGSDEWYVFPWTARSTTTGDSTADKSGYFGLAYKKNTA